MIPFFRFPPEIRKIVYTTNAIESLNMSLRKAIKTRGAFPSEDGFESDVPGAEKPGQKMERRAGLERGPQPLRITITQFQPGRLIHTQKI